MKDPNPRMRIQAIRASETLYKAGHRALIDDYRAAAKDADTDVMIQGMLTLHLFKAPDLATVVKEAQAANSARGVQLIGTQILQPAMASTGGGGRGVTPEQRSTLQRGETIYTELCSICHGPDGRGAPGEGGGAIKAPSFVGSSRVQGHRDYVVNAILHGMTGPIDGRTYTDVMVPMGTNRDDWVAAAASYLRNNFGNSSSFVTPEDVARVRAATADRKTPWTYSELAASLPVALVPQNTWNATASHNTQAAAGGLNYAGWSTGAPQQPGMWFQIELPEPVMLTEIQFNSTPQSGGRGGVPGGRGRWRGPGRAPRRRRHRQWERSPAGTACEVSDGRQDMGCSPWPKAREAGPTRRSRFVQSARSSSGSRKRQPWRPGPRGPFSGSGFTRRPAARRNAWRADGRRLVGALRLA